MVTEQIFKEAEILALKNQAKILMNVFSDKETSCSCCNYPNNQDFFENILNIYCKYKLNLHWENKRLSNTFEIKIQKLDVIVAQYRDLLKTMWPCNNCMKIYNPTGKLKYKNKDFKNVDWSKLTKELNVEGLFS